MSHDRNALGIIAGSRSLPLILARAARSAGVERLVAVGFVGETDPALAGLVDELVWVKVGQLVKLIDAFRTQAITRCVMAGQVSPKNLFNVRPDLRALALLIKLKERNARTIFSAIADELRKDGIQLVEGTPWLKPFMPEPGYRIGPKPSAAEQADAALGRQIAKEISKFEIGQIVVVRKGTVLAVEGFEGTDACLKRGGELAGAKGGAVAVKVAAANHDFRFDIPCLGPQTVEVCAAAKIRVLAFEGGRTLLLEQAQAEAIAARDGITLLSL
jgi:DUF1009 family protein